ncbi:MAG: GntR family transcriptional regulator [Anaerolineae bacterium]|jgi:DNA-binding GntR family transcriptional regulator
MPQKSLEPIERPLSAAQRVSEQITQAIVRGELEPGQRLVETTIAEQLGVSRSPIREAFHQLEQLGLVEKIPYRGVFVSELTEHDVRELYTVREPLEGLAARLLAKGDNEAAAAELQAILDDMAEAAAAGDARRVMELNADFHDSLVRLTEHDLLQEIWSIVGNRMRRFLYLSKPRSDLMLGEVVPLHRRIVRAIAEGDAERAEAEARQHVVRYVEQRKVLKDR